MSDKQISTVPVADVVCFGMIIPALVLAVDGFPQHNTGIPVREAGEFVFDDAAIVACLLRQWGVQSALIGTALGEDAAGRRMADRLRELGVQGEIRLSADIKTPVEVDISDPTGARTFFWERKPEVLATLDTADLSPVDGARLLYVDWYDGEHILRPVEKAVEQGIPVFLNLEHGHLEPDILRRYTRGVSICQVVTDAAQREESPETVARTVAETGVETVLVTMAGDGCFAMRGDEALRVWSPEVAVVDGCAAGATFSAGFAYGHLRGWSLGEAVRFAVAAASLKCTVLGPRAFPVEDIGKLAAGLRMEHL
ncbi:MAG TPA: carbohydrate kinase family protein [Dehalococcoidia bacterium]|nr:carbohydrate kinase family protein [Dehalococcoidia bacterium]